MSAIRRWRTAFACAVVGASLAIAPALAQTLKVVKHSDLKILDPVWSGANIVRNHGYMIYDVLFALDADLKPQPQMIDKWEVSADKLTYTFTLRDGLAWHDGPPVTTEDVVASLRRWGKRDSMGQKLMDFVASMPVVDAKTFRIVLKEPYGLVIDSLAKPSIYVPFIMPKRVAETDHDKQLSDTTGSGPFIFRKEEWKPGDKVVYVRNPNYKPRAEPASGLAGGKVAKVERIEWHSIPDHQTAVNALIAGEIDIVETIPHDLIPMVAKEKGVKLYRGRYPGQYTFRPNWLHPPFDNPKIREAVGYALNQMDFLEAVIGNKEYFRTCKALFVCDTPMATDAGTGGRLEGNTAKARELLKEAGYDGTPIVLLHSTDLAVLTNLAPTAKSLLEKAGFKVEMRSMDWQSLVTRLAKKDPPANGGWSAFMTSWGALDLLNPLMTQFLNASCDKAGRGWPCDAEIEALRDRFARETDPAKQKAIAEAAQIRAVRIGTHFQLGEWYGVAGFNSRIEGWQSPPVTVFWNLSKK